MKISRKIIFIGATGMLGLPVVKELAEAGFEVTAFVRNLDDLLAGSLIFTPRALIKKCSANTGVWIGGVRRLFSPATGI